MTVKELIEELKKMPQDCIVIISGSEDNYTSSPRTNKYDFDYHYWDNTNELLKIPPNTVFVEL